MELAASNGAKCFSNVAFNAISCDDCVSPEAVLITSIFSAYFSYNSKLYSPNISMSPMTSESFAVSGSGGVLCEEGDSVNNRDEGASSGFLR